MAELVDAADSKSVVREDVGVRVSLGAPIFTGIVVYQKFVESQDRQFPYLTPHKRTGLSAVVVKAGETGSPDRRSVKRRCPSGI